MRKKLHDGARYIRVFYGFNQWIAYLHHQAQAGADSLDTIATHLVGDVKDCARDEMAGRTGEMDSEMSGKG